MSWIRWILVCSVILMGEAMGAEMAASLISEGGQGLTDFFHSSMDTIWNIKKYKRALKREDSAVQRRVADLKKAGLNPVLAAGQSASSMSPPVSSSMGSDAGSNIASEILQGIQLESNVSRTNAEIGLIDKQKAKVDAEKASIEEKTRTERYNRELSEFLNLRTNETNSLVTTTKAIIAGIKSLYGNDSAPLNRFMTWVDQNKSAKEKAALGDQVANTRLYDPAKGAAELQAIEAEMERQRKKAENGEAMSAQEFSNFLNDSLGWRP